MDKDQISMLLLMNMNRFHNLIKIVNNEKFKTEKTLTERQFFALSSIMKHKKIELKNLSKDLYVSTSSLCILLNKLVERGLVYREEDARDRRNTFYGITEEGLKIVNAEIEELIEVLNRKLDVLSKDDLNKLSSSMDEIKHIMDKLL